MKRAVLRGFAYADQDIGKRVRFCNPIFSFEGDAPSLYLAETLNWEYSPDAPVSLTRIWEDDVSRFATMINDSRTRHYIRPGEGVVALGSRFAENARAAHIPIPGINVPIRENKSTGTIAFKESTTSFGDIFIGIATLKSYRRFSRYLVRRCGSVFGDELAMDDVKSLSDGARSTLFLLRHCSETKLMDLARYELAAARLDEDDTYKDLLRMFALELGKEERHLEQIVDRYLRRTKGLSSFGVRGLFAGRDRVTHKSSVSAADPVYVLTKRDSPSRLGLREISVGSLIAIASPVYQHYDMTELADNRRPGIEMDVTGSYDYSFDRAGSFMESDRDTDRLAKTSRPHSLGYSVLVEGMGYEDHGIEVFIHRDRWIVTGRGETPIELRSIVETGAVAMNKEDFKYRLSAISTGGADD